MKKVQIGIIGRLFAVMLGACILQGTAAQAKDSDASLPSSKVYVYKDITGYVSENKTAEPGNEMELFFPANHDPTKEVVPAILFFHGGGWRRGGRNKYRDYGKYFAQRGLVVATAAYRMKETIKTSADKEICITDAKSAIRWLKQHAKELGIDSNRIVTGGDSAGGHIALLASMTPGLNDPKDPLQHDTSVAAHLLYVPAIAPKKDALVPAVSFSAQLTANLPPSILFCGSEDGWNGWKAAIPKIKALGLDKTMDIRIAEGEGHGFVNQAPWRDIVLIESDRFLIKLGFLKGPPLREEPETDRHLLSFWKQTKQANKKLRTK